MRDVTPFCEAAGHEIRVSERAWRHGLPVLFKGPTGCDKTRFVQYMAWCLEPPLYSVTCHNDLGAADLLGRHLIGADGTWWQDGPLTRTVCEGSIYYLNEAAKACQDIAVAIRPLVDDHRELRLKRIGETLQAPPSLMLVVSYSPGYQNLLKGSKPNTRQHFVALRFDYPVARQEARILVGESGCAEALVQRLVQLGQALRRLEQHDLEEVALIRLLIFAARLIGDGMDLHGACRAALAEPLSGDPATVAALMDIVDLHIA